MDYRTRRLVNGVIVVCILSIIAVVVVGLLARRTSGVDFTILFQDAKGLPIGSQVTLRGLRVGEVTRVELGTDKKTIEVDVSITPQYANEIPEPAGVTARIKKSLFLPGNYSIALVIQKDAKGHMPKGGRVEGVESWAGEKKFEAKGAIRRTYEAAAEKTSARMDQLKDWWAKRGETKQQKKINKQMFDWLEKVETIDPDTPPAKIKALRTEAKMLAAEWRAEGFEEEAVQIEETADALDDFEKSETTK